MKNILNITGLLMAALLNCSVYGQQINNAEYFFDNDPGVGHGTAITISSSADSIDISDSIHVTGLHAGFHTLCVRVQNANGIWSLYQPGRIYLDSASIVSSSPITGAEYFFDKDPGVGNGISVSTGASANLINDTLQAPTTGLSSGFHQLFVRVKNQNGNWSLYNGNTFYISNPASPDTTGFQIVAGEVYLDTDLAEGTGTPITPSFAGADSIDIFRSFSTEGQLPGIYYIFARVKNSLGIWSYPDSLFFTICVMSPVAQFTDSSNSNTVYFQSASTFDSTYQWQFGDGDTSSEHNPVHTYNIPGDTFSVQLVVGNNCTTDTLVQKIFIHNPTGIDPVSNTFRAYIFPNPNNGNFVLSYHLAQTESELQITDITGRRIFSNSIPGTEGTQNINTTGLGSGIYYWRIASGNQISAAGKMVIVR